MSLIDDIMIDAASKGKRMLVAELKEVPTIWMTETVSSSARMIGEIAATIIRSRIESSSGEMEQEESVRAFFFSARIACEKELARLHLVEVNSPGLTKDSTIRLISSNGSKVE